MIAGDPGHVLVRAPASSANLGPGFDALGMALAIHDEIGTGPPPDGARAIDDHHPATVAFRRAGGAGPLWERCRIPMGRGLGYSGAARVAGALAGAVLSGGEAACADGRPTPATAAAVLSITTELEGHADNVAASLHGGVVVAAGGRVVRVPLAVDPVVVTWVPGSTTSTDRSRALLADQVSRADAVFNLSRAALLVAALAAGDVAALRTATEDRLHQPVRFRDAPGSAEALHTGLELGAWAGWLSGSGPTVAFLADREGAQRLADGLPAGGAARVVPIDHDGARLIRCGTSSA